MRSPDLLDDLLDHITRTSAVLGAAYSFSIDIIWWNESVRPSPRKLYKSSDPILALSAQLFGPVNSTMLDRMSSVIHSKNLSLLMLQKASNSFGFGARPRFSVRQPTHNLGSLVRQCQRSHER
ncbi:hypothetical protein QA645_40025 [Bradyrhizobium sp. CIAT3101]|uniref:hypothetical protein n=1 Tax=Bradyrhizobium sp. CIAT3101 TaxID=439387 RepID=UPI0024B059CF|nr:hypothetical protein [Bradyrhizobium sp. CIAT3101]WFU80571.1 hypothetical protein QA645_40025 [Bradyrhizobium sp. CIAT3101]